MERNMNPRLNHAIMLLTVLMAVALETRTETPILPKPSFS